MNGIADINEKDESICQLLNFDRFFLPNFE